MSLLTNSMGVEGSASASDIIKAVTDAGYGASLKVGGSASGKKTGLTASEKLKADLRKVYASRGGKENLWEMVPLRILRKNYRLEVRECAPSDVTEIDTFVELVAADPSYEKYPGYEQFR